MRRRLSAIGMFLVLGAIANVAVAWTAVIFDGTLPNGLSVRVEGDRFENRLIVAWDRLDPSLARDPIPSPPPAGGLQASGIGVTRTTTIVRDTPWDEWQLWMFDTRVKRPVILMLFATDAGWPTRSLASEAWSGSPSHGSRPGLDYRSTTRSLRTPISSRGDIAVFHSEVHLPLAPLMPGFIVNTLFYAILLWLFFAALFAIRSTQRRRRGLCEKCGYPIGVSPVCTECGAKIALRHSRRNTNT